VVKIFRKLLTVRRSGQLNLSGTAVTEADGGTEFGAARGVYCKMRKWKWLFVNI
jgi:hypothetical protein